jgi:hypothetical protein
MQAAEAASLTSQEAESSVRQVEILDEFTGKDGRKYCEVRYMRHRIVKAGYNGGLRVLRHGALVREIRDEDWVVKHLG